MNQTGEELKDFAASLMPFGSTLRYEFDLTEAEISKNAIWVEPEAVVPPSDDDDLWPGYFGGGTDFTMINWEFFNGREYDHFWHAGYGGAQQDRFYHNR